MRRREAPPHTLSVLRDLVLRALIETNALNS